MCAPVWVDVNLTLWCRAVALGGGVRGGEALERGGPRAVRCALPPLDMTMREPGVVFSPCMAEGSSL